MVSVIYPINLVNFPNLWIVFDIILSAINMLTGDAKLDETLNHLIYEELTFIVDKRLRDCEENSDHNIGVKLFRVIDLFVTKMDHGANLVLYTLNFFKLKKNYSCYSYLSMALLNKIAAKPKNLESFVLSIMDL